MNSQIFTNSLNMMQQQVHNTTNIAVHGAKASDCILNGCNYDYNGICRNCGSRRRFSNLYSKLHRLKKMQIYYSFHL